MTKITKLRCLALDDEPLALDILRQFIGRVPSLDLVAICGNSLDALARVHEGAIDLIFLDIEMPDLNGIEFLRILNGRCLVVLTTAYQEYALEGYEHAVLDYLLKPIPFERFLKSVQRAVNAQANLRPHQRTDDFPNESILEELQIPDFIFVKVENRIVKVDLDDILYVLALKDYVRIFTKNGPILSLQTMLKMGEILPATRFARVHKSYIVALSKIESVEKQRIYIGKDTVPIGDTYLKDFMRKVGGA